MRIKKVAVIVVLAVLAAVAVRHWYHSWQTCAVLAGPATVSLYGGNMEAALRPLQHKTRCRYTVFSDADPEAAAAFLLELQPDFIVAAADRVPLLSAIKSVAGDSRIAAALFQPADIAGDGILVAAPDYDRLESRMAELYRGLGDSREFVFAGGADGLPEDLSLFGDSSKAVGAVTVIRPELFPANIVFYADPGIAGLLPEIIDNLRKLSVGQVSIVPIIKKTTTGQGK